MSFPRLTLGIEEEYQLLDPATRELSPSIVGGVILVITVYLLANWAYLNLLGLERVASSRAIAADAVGAGDHRDVGAHHPGRRDDGPDVRERRCRHQDRPGAGDTQSR
ncbi:MAG: hypothetical protein HC793_02775 [Aquincola sp.]|nr:hypothetical protein [Aquincola sp.]